MIYTTDELISTLKTRAAIPENQPAFTDEELIKIMDRELRYFISPFIYRLNSGYFLTYYDYTISASKLSYMIPTGSMNGILETVQIIDNENIINVEQITTAATSTDKSGFYLFGNNLVIDESYAKNNAGKTLRLYYFSNPNTLELIENAGEITVLDTTYVEVESVPSSWTGTINIDVVMSLPPFEKLYSGSAVVSGNQIQFTVPDTIAVGDYVTLTGYAVVPMIPPITHDLLIQKSVMRVLEALGKADEAQLTMADLNTLVENSKNVLSPRVSSNRKIIKNNRGIMSCRKSLLI